MSPDFPSLRTVVGAILVDSLVHPTRVAAARRTGPPELAGYWEFPGGKLEVGETAESGLARELDEELSIAVRIGLEFSDSGRPWQISDHLELRLFFAEIAAGQLAPGPVHDAVAWLSCDNLTAVPWLVSDASAVTALGRSLASSVGRSSISTPRIGARSRPVSDVIWRPGSGDELLTGEADVPF